MAVIAIVVGVLVVSGGGDDDDGDASAESTAATVDDTAAPATSGATAAPTTPTTPAAAPDATAVAPGAIPYPLTFSQAVTDGIDGAIDWGARCDTTRGRLAFPDYFAPECYAPFDGDNGGATSQGITEDTIKLVWYLAPEQDPIINYITD
ncbi:MAG TPA: hypothetical protein VFT09_13095, partial [Ilumatobacteraceae bacterium]|nr:hypothetical protein [Ilumatobacteraceae bacterium]